MLSTVRPFSGRRVAARRFAAALLAVSTLAAGLGVAPDAHAEGTIRVAEQFGNGYMRLNVARDPHLLEKEGR